LSVPKTRPRSLWLAGETWRDVGFVLGALIAGLGADATSPRAAIAIVAMLTAASGLVVAATPGSDAQHSYPLPPANRKERSAEMAVEVDIDVEVLKREIKKTYASVSQQPDKDFIFPTRRPWAEDLGYPDEFAEYFPVQRG
jgi:hypothetical protein